MTRTRPKGRDRTRQPLSEATRPADCELVKPGLNRFQAIRAAHWIRIPPLLCAHRHGYFAHLLPLLNWLHGSIRAANHGSSSGVSADQPRNAKQPFEGRRRSAGSSLGNPFRPQVKVFFSWGGGGDLIRNPFREVISPSVCGRRSKVMDDGRAMPKSAISEPPSASDVALQPI